MELMLFRRFTFHKKRIRNPGNRIDITQLTSGESAKVVELNDNGEIISKLEAMGIIPGAVVTKKSAISSRGPIILEKNMVQFAIGYDMAQRIIVEPVMSGIVP